MSHGNEFLIQRKINETANAAARFSGQKKSGTFLVDNRAQAVTQKKQIDEIQDNNTSREIIQKKINSSATDVVQLATHGANSGQAYTYNGNQVTVGKSMWAKLDPGDKLQGQSASVNTSQDDMMDAIRDEYNLTGNEVVKGHLLNDNLGGTALDANLFPISGEANKKHLHNVESVAKTVYAEGHGIYYTVDVQGASKLKNPNATFKVKLAPWDPKTDKIGPYVTNNLNVYSYLARAKRKRAEVSGITVGKGSAPHVNFKKSKFTRGKKGRLLVPKKRIGDLSPIEKKLRLKQPRKYNL